MHKKSKTKRKTRDETEPLLPLLLLLSYLHFSKTYGSCQTLVFQGHGAASDKKAGLNSVKRSDPLWLWCRIYLISQCGQKIIKAFFNCLFGLIGIDILLLLKVRDQS